MDKERKRDRNLKDSKVELRAGGGIRTLAGLQALLTGLSRKEVAPVAAAGSGLRVSLQGTEALSQGVCS